MSNLLEHYKVLGVQVGAGLADVTSSYRQLCRTYHPDVSDDPGAEELMKRINIAYTVLREKFKREAAFRERQTYTRPVRRYSNPETRQQSTAEQAADIGSSKEAFAVLHGYFGAINSFDYSRAYDYLSDYDKQYITRESFIEWRESVSRLYPMREFKIAGGSSIAAVTWGDNKSFQARRFRVTVTEDDFADDAQQSGNVEKLVVYDNGTWGVFLGYRGVDELIRSFDERFESKRRRDIAKHWEELYTGLHAEYNMLNINGIRKTVTRELYRQRRFGGSMTFAVISVQMNGNKNTGQDDLLRSAAKTICGAMRETDVPAYAGDGVFAIMYVELRKKNAEEIISRLVDTIRKKAGSQLGTRADIEYVFESYSGNSYADIDSINKLLKKFRKKM